MAPRPLIGMTTYRQVARWGAWDREAALVPSTYLTMVRAAGGTPLLLPPPGLDEVWDEDGLAGEGRGVVGALDGLVFLGGGDLDPARYGQSAHERVGGVNGARDAWEFALARAALEADLPMLAICRGLQVLNVLTGGTLCQHVPDLVATTAHQPRTGAFNPVEVVTEPGSRTADVLGTGITVSCSHHQAIDDLGQGLVVTARSADGVVEAVERPDSEFLMAVQWHPEEDRDVRLFAALVAAALHRADRRDSHPQRSTPPTPPA